MPWTARICIPKTMASVCALKSEWASMLPSILSCGKAKHLSSAELRTLLEFSSSVWDGALRLSPGLPPSLNALMPSDIGTMAVICVSGP